MIKPSLVVIIALFVSCVVAQTDVGAGLPSKVIPKHNRDVCAATPSQTYPCLQNVTLDGLRFAVVGYDERTHRVKYLLTYDDSFRTEDGLHVGSVMEWSEGEVWGARGGFVVGPRTEDGWRPILSGLYFNQKLECVDGDSVDLENRVSGKKHRFKVLGFDKGGL